MRHVVDADRSRAEALVRAAFEATRHFRTDPKTTLDVLSQEPKALMKIESDRELERTYEIMRDELCEIPVPSAEGIANMRRMAMLSDPALADFNPMLMWDLSFAAKIADDYGGPRLG
jgi:hypothetical protein